ncbi:hypothetical protein [Isoptericola sp. NPDC057191]|uniref:hypothetical protein n=1 Tax=Isoptericola sp. NPDC057191 TaxID=3346041 RepID=UPI0036391CE9
MERHTQIRAAVAGTLTLAMIGVGTTAVAAEDPTDKVADLIDKVAPHQGEVVDVEAHGAAVRTRTDMVTTTVPLDPDAPVSLTSHDAATPSLEVNLPDDLSLDTGTVADDGTVVYHAPGRETSAAVQNLDDGSVRLQTITADPDGQRRFTYTFGDDVMLSQAGDGTVELLAPREEGGAIVLGLVDRPWAADAAGRPVDTEYRVVGDALVQTIHPDAATVYPVVADPRVDPGFATLTVRFTKKETRKLRDGATAGLLAAWLPFPFGAMVATASYLVQRQARSAASQRKCVKIVIYGYPPVATWWPHTYSGGYCR